MIVIMSQKNRFIYNGNDNKSNYEIIIIFIIIIKIMMIHITDKTLICKMILILKMLIQTLGQN